MLKAAFLVTEECFKEGDVWFGTPIIFGTSNQINNGLKDFEELYYNAEKYNLIPLFIPANKSYYPFIDLKTGISDTVEAKKAIEKERLKKKGLSDKLAYYTYLQEMPLVISDAFQIGVSSIFDLELIHNQIEYNERPSVKGIIQKGRLEWLRDVEGNELKEVEWIPDEHGKHQMLYPPEEKIPEVSGVDSYVKDESEVSDSKGCLISRRGSTFEDTVDNLPVHIYYDRPSTKSVFYNECAKVAIWRKVKLLVEDTDEMFFEWFIRSLRHHD